MSVNFPSNLPTNLETAFLNLSERVDGNWLEDLLAGLSTESFSGIGPIASQLHLEFDEAVEPDSPSEGDGIDTPSANTEAGDSRSENAQWVLDNISEFGNNSSAADNGAPDGYAFQSENAFGANAAAQENSEGVEHTFSFDGEGNPTLVLSGVHSSVTGQHGIVSFDGL
jgi:hypothetical protein